MSKQDVIYVRGIESCEFRYEWTIENFIDCNELIESPIFSSHYSDFNDKWILIIYPYYRFIDDKPYIMVELQLQSFNNTSQLRAKCTISNDDMNEVTKSHTFSEFQEKIRWNNYRVLNSTSPGAIYRRVQDGKLKICCTITMSKELTNDCAVVSTFIEPPQLSQDFKKLLLNEKSADVTIEVGRKSFRAIKGVLGARSPVFSAMFDHQDLKENKKNIVVITDIDEDVFEEFLHFIYTGESPNIDKMPMELH
ncbi:protein roadkill-like [Aphidius gifuensis]|uniref:protein roadkill-like n=1 Tax=Aphidius gifuensis TaxID=684658 RepID=UPI001CDC97E5|nr:protein roadkill-like [Aphidius gifuensis]